MEKGLSFLTVKVGVAKIPTKWIQYSEVVPAHNHNKYYHFYNNSKNDSEIFQLELETNIIFKVNSVRADFFLQEC